MNPRETTWFQELSLNLLRFWAGFQIAQHGAQKLFGVLGRESPAETFSIFWVAGVTEFFGGILLIFGLFTRPVAFLLCGQMAVAFWWRHFPPFWPVISGPEARDHRPEVQRGGIVPSGSSGTDWPSMRR